MHLGGADDRLAAVGVFHTCLAGLLYHVSLRYVALRYVTLL